VFDAQKSDTGKRVRLRYHAIRCMLSALVYSNAEDIFTCVVMKPEGI